MPNRNRNNRKSVRRKSVKGTVSIRSAKWSTVNRRVSKRGSVRVRKRSGRRSRAKTRMSTRSSSSVLRPIVNASQPTVSVVIPAADEHSTIAKVIRNAWRVHPETEVIVVANGSHDGTDRIAARMGAHVIQYPQRLGHDVGRSIGARSAQGKVILFVDGDFVVETKDLKPIVQAVLQGKTDVALNSYIGPVKNVRVHKVILAKHALNAAMGRPDLSGVSMTTIPHALSRHALEVIGVENLAVPPKAQAIALDRGLIVRPVHFIHAGRKNRKRNRIKGTDPVGDLIVGDHLEAMNWVLQEHGARGGFEDQIRSRSKVRW